MRHEDSQSMKVLRYLERGNRITSFRAFTLFGITRLSAVIWILRNDGYQIESRMVSNEDGRLNYAEYWLKEQSNG